MSKVSSSLGSIEYFLNLSFTKLDLSSFWELSKCLFFKKNYLVLAFYSNNRIPWYSTTFFCFDCFLDVRASQPDQHPTHHPRPETSGNPVLALTLDAPLLLDNKLAWFMNCETSFTYVPALVVYVDVLKWANLQSKQEKKRKLAEESLQGTWCELK